MIDQSLITKGLEALIRDSLNSGLVGCTVDRSTQINFDPARCPWLGIYPGDVDSEPKTISPASWREKMDVQVVIQTSAYSSEGQAASDELESLIKVVLDVVGTDLTLGVNGVRVIGISRQYSYVLTDENGTGDLFMPQVVIKLKLESRV